MPFIVDITKIASGILWKKGFPSDVVEELSGDVLIYILEQIENTKHLIA